MIENEGIRCELRGETYLKGKGLVVTHLVHTDYELPADHSNIKDFPSLSSLRAEKDCAIIDGICPINTDCLAHPFILKVVLWPGRVSP